MTVNFIRHGKTAGNLERRYIGATDEPLCGEGISELSGRAYPDCGLVVCSPMKRCVETAEIIYPNKKIVFSDSLRECDFGDFEGKNALELSLDKYYREWINSGGKLPFPNGENIDEFKSRCCGAFLEIYEKIGEKSSVSLVVHGGTIMAIMERFSRPKRDYFDYRVKNGCGFSADFDGEKIMIISEIK